MAAPASTIVLRSDGIDVMPVVAELPEDWMP